MRIGWRKPSTREVSHTSPTAIAPMSTIASAVTAVHSVLRCQGVGNFEVLIAWHWARIERARGEYDFSAYDRLVAALERNKLRAVFILDYGNKLHDADSPRTDEGRAAFARWAATAVQHYAGKGFLWELWN